MKPNERFCHITHLSKEVMDACVETLCLAQEDSEKYFLESKEVAVDILNILNGIHYCL